MALANPTWGEERIAAELLLKLGIRVSPRTVRRYLPSGGGFWHPTDLAMLGDIRPQSRPGGPGL